MRIDVRALMTRSTALATAAVALTAAASGVVAADGRGGRAAETQLIASSVLGEDVKYTLTALRSTSDPLAATVRLRVFVQRDGAWVLSDQAVVGEQNGWFWFPLTGSGAVCEFSTASTDPAPVAVSLLITPSIGCSPTERFLVRDGKITSATRATRAPHGGVGAGGGGTAGAAVNGNDKRGEPGAY